MNNNIILISWQSFNPHSQLLGTSFNADIYYIKDLIKTRRLLWELFFIFDYFYKSVKTLIIILTARAKCVIIQNPVSIAVIITVFFKPILKFKVIADSHNGAFASPWGNFPLHKWSLRKSDIVIVHNQQLLNRLHNSKNYKGINFKILNSRVSEFSEIKTSDLKTKHYFLVVSTFASDEPMEALLEGLRLYNKKNSDSIIFKLTGNYKKKTLLYDEYKNDSNIEFLGFVSNEQYEYLMVNAFGVISFSTRDDVQQFALMESVGAEVPFLSNNNLTNRALFGDKMVFVEVTAEKIVEGINLFIKDKERLDKNILELKNEICTKWEKDFNLIKSDLGI